MKLGDILKRAARSLKNAKARTILTSLAIAVGAFTITISLAAGAGARQYADKLIGSNVNPRVLFIVKDKSLFEANASQSGLREYDPDVGTTTSGATIKQMTQSDVDALQKRGDLEYVTPTYNLQIRYLRFEGSDTRFTANVSSYDPTIMSETAAGSLPQNGQQLHDTEIVVPESFATTLVDKKIIHKTSDLIGKTVTLTIAQSQTTISADELAAAYARGGEAAVATLTAPQTSDLPFTVRALSKRSATSLSGSSVLQISANQARYIAEYTTKGTNTYQKYFGVTALAKKDKDPATIKAELETKGFAAQTAKDLQSLIFSIVNTLQGIVAGFGVVALIASVFGIINTQYISVLERTREIGLMKALGMRGKHVSRLFQFEAAWIGFLGGIIGAGLAIAIGTLMNPWITKKLDIGTGNHLLIFQPLPIGIMIVGLILIAMLAGYFPARKAAHLDPIEALRTE